MLVIRLKTDAVMRRMIVMALMPVIVLAYCVAAASGLIAIKSLPIIAAASVLCVGLSAFFVCFAVFKLKNPIVFLLDDDGSGFYRPTFRRFDFRVAPCPTVEMRGDGVVISPKIQGLPYFAARDGVTFIETNRTYDVQFGQ